MINFLDDVDKLLDELSVLHSDSSLIKSPKDKDIQVLLEQGDIFRSRLTYNMMPYLLFNFLFV